MDCCRKRPRSIAIAVLIGGAIGTLLGFVTKRYAKSVPEKQFYFYIIKTRGYEIKPAVMTRNLPLSLCQKNVNRQIIAALSLVAEIDGNHEKKLTFKKIQIHIDLSSLSHPTD
jgi:hypothetical protein